MPDVQEELYSKDIELCDVKLRDIATVTSSTGVKSFYDYLQFSPLKVSTTCVVDSKRNEGSTESCWKRVYILAKT